MSKTWSTENDIWFEETPQTTTLPAQTPSTHHLKTPQLLTPLIQQLAQC